MNKILLLILVAASLNLSAQSISFNPLSIDPLTAVVNEFSTIQTVTLQAAQFSMSGLLNVQTSGDFQVSLDQNIWSNVLTITVNTSIQTPLGTKYSLMPTNLYIRFAPTTVGAATGGVSASMQGRFALLNLSGTASSVTSSMELNATKLVVYPNPTKGNLKVEGIEKGIYDYKMLTILGVIVKEGKMENNELDVTDLSNGTFNLYLSSGDKKYAIQIIKN